MTDDLTETELARLADGSLSAERAAALRTRVDASPELTARLREQERGARLVASTADLPAPASLHTTLAARTAGRPRAGRVGRAGPGGAALAAAAAAIIVIVLVTAGGSGLTVQRTAGLALAPATRPAPTIRRDAPDLLSLRVGPISFPAYAPRTHWSASGARTDVVSGHRVQTVFYTTGRQRIGYSIVGGRALAVPAGTRHVIRGTTFVTTTIRGARVVTWRRAGHTCVAAGRGIASGRLLALAAASELVS